MPHLAHETGLATIYQQLEAREPTLQCSAFLLPFLQAFKARERDLTLALSEADTRLETQAASLSLLTERVTSAEEGARKAESESAQLRARLSASEQALKAAHKECAKLKVGQTGAAGRGRATKAFLKC
jgi:chromosome segregation ATPase